MLHFPMMAFWHLRQVPDACDAANEPVVCVVDSGAPCAYDTTCMTTRPDSTVGKCSPTDLLPSGSDCSAIGEFRSSDLYTYVKLLRTIFQVPQSHFHGAFELLPFLLPSCAMLLTATAVNWVHIMQCV